MDDRPIRMDIMVTNGVAVKVSTSPALVNLPTDTAIEPITAAGEGEEDQLSQHVPQCELY